MEEFDENKTIKNCTAEELEVALARLRNQAATVASINQVKFEASAMESSIEASSDRKRKPENLSGTEDDENSGDRPHHLTKPQREEPKGKWAGYPRKALLDKLEDIFEPFSEDDPSTAVIEFFAGGSSFNDSSISRPARRRNW
jgi:hypothetical protein